jgi:hypothetical protein
MILKSERGSANCRSPAFMCIVLVHGRKQNEKQSSRFEKTLRLLPAATEQLGKMKEYLAEYGN